MKLVGEKTIGPFLVELEKDNLKMAKIKEFCDSAVIVAKASGVKKAPAAPAKAPRSAAPSRPDSKKTTGKYSQFILNICVLLFSYTG